MRRHTETNKKRNTDSLYIHALDALNSDISEYLPFSIHSFPFKPNQSAFIRFDSSPIRVLEMFFPIGGHLAAEDTCCPTSRSTSFKIPPQKRDKGLFPPQWVWFLELEHVAGCLLIGGVVQRWSVGQPFVVTIILQAKLYDTIKWRVGIAFKDIEVIQRPDMQKETIIFRYDLN